jgi:hypothetical protein
MSLPKNPFGTSLRRNPADPRGLLERIDAVVRERLEEAVENVSIDCLVRLRKARSQPAPRAESAGDREEFQALVRDLLLHLRAGYLEGLAAEDLRRLTEAERAPAADEVARLLEGQAALARALPDYWQRFEILRVSFLQTRLAAPPPRRGRLDRLLGR